MREYGTFDGTDPSDPRYEQEGALTKTVFKSGEVFYEILPGDRITTTVGAQVVVCDCAVANQFFKNKQVAKVERPIKYTEVWPSKESPDA